MRNWGDCLSISGLISSGGAANGLVSIGSRFDRRSRRGGLDGLGGRGSAGLVTTVGSLTSFFAKCKLTRFDDRLKLDWSFLLRFRF